MEVENQEELRRVNRNVAVRGEARSRIPCCRVRFRSMRSRGDGDGPGLGQSAGSGVDVWRDVIHQVEIVGDQGIGGLPRPER